MAADLRAQALAAYQEAELAYRRGDFAVAEENLRHALATWKSSGDQEAGDEAALLVALGRTLEAQQRFREAEQQARAAVMSLERVERSGETDALLIQALQLLGSTLRQQQLFDEAEAPLRRALQRSFELPGQPGTIANAYNDLAILYKQTARYQDAQEAYERALKLCEDHPEAVDPQAVIALYANLGALAQTAGDEEGAADWFQKAWERNQTAQSKM